MPRDLLPAQAASPRPEVEARLLLEEERCAADAYRHALERKVSPAHPEPLSRLQQDHAEAARRLASCLRDPDIRAAGPRCGPS